MSTTFSFLAFLLIASFCAARRSPVNPITPLTSQIHTSTRLRVEYLENPINIDTPFPRFSWACVHPTRGEKQSQYRIIVKLQSNQAIVWDSGVVNSAETLNIPFGEGGRTALLSNTDYTWTVVWTDTNKTASVPATGKFSTALLRGAVDGQGAQWIAPSGTGNILRTEVILTSAPVRARLFISGLGFYRAWINGELTDDHVVGPFLTFEKRVSYDVVDVTKLLRQGCNAIAISLGTGWYAQSSVNVGPKSLWMMLSIDTEVGPRTYVVTNPGNTFLTTSGPVTADDIYNGENYDARLEQHGWKQCNFFQSNKNTTVWQPSVSTRNATATAVFVSRKFQVRPDRVYSPLNITQPLDGAYVFDFGQNIAGITTLRVLCPSGSQTIQMSYGESLHEDGTVLNQYGNIMFSNFTCAGTGSMEEYTTLHGQYAFRFVQVTNYPGVPTEEAFTAYFIHADVEEAGSFATDNNGLNAIEHATRFAALSNLMDIPTDCPQRERRGWLGDAQLSCETNIHQFDMSAFYTKWMDDVSDSQNTQGQVPDCAPFYGHGNIPADPAWSVAFPAITSWWRSYGVDDRIARMHYDGIKAYVESQIAQLTPQGYLHWALYGDWCSVADGFNTGCSFTRDDISTFHFLRAVDVLVEFATAFNYTADLSKYSALAAKTRSIYNQYFFHADTNTYSDGYPISQLLALATPNLVPASIVPKVVANLVSSLQSGSHSGYKNATTGGIIFMKYAFDVLDNNGATDEALRLLLNTAFPSILNWIENQPVPATTLWENWQSTSTAPEGSYNHIMYGGFGAWLYRGIGGLDRAAGSPGWRHLLIHPPNPDVVAPYMTRATTSIDTPSGFISVSWNTDPSSANCAANAPENSIVVLSCPGGQFTNVTFASFGLPTGGCQQGFAINPQCNAANSVEIVKGLCVGKSSCSIPATNDEFGGDPCLGTPKHLSVQLAGDCPKSAYLTDATIPANTKATVVIPLSSVAAASSALTITEGSYTVWSKGQFVPGTPGITKGTLVNAGKAIELECGSGSYLFSVNL